MPCQLQLTSRQMHKHQGERTDICIYAHMLSHLWSTRAHTHMSTHKAKKELLMLLFFFKQSLLFHTMSAMTVTSRQTHKHHGECTKTYAYMPTCSHTGGLHTYIYMHMSSHKAKKELLFFSPFFFLTQSSFYAMSAMTVNHTGDLHMYICTCPHRRQRRNFLHLLFVFLDAKSSFLCHVSHDSY